MPPSIPATQNPLLKRSTVRTATTVLVRFSLSRRGHLDSSIKIIPQLSDCVHDPPGHMADHQFIRVHFEALPRRVSKRGFGGKTLDQEADR